MIPLVSKTDTDTSISNLYLLLFLNQARTGHRLARIWFLKIDPVWIIGMRVRVCVCVCVYVYVCVCVCAQGY